MNRLTERADDPGPEDRTLDYFEIETRCGTWHVSTVMARHIEADLDAGERPAWISFVDVVGARVRVRTDTIQSLTQSTAAQRAMGFARMKRLREERQAEAGWDD